MKFLFGMLALLALTVLTVGAQVDVQATGAESPDPIIEFVGEIILSDLKPQTSLWGRIADVLGGEDERELGRPVDVALDEGTAWLTCQGLGALVEVELISARYRLHFPQDGVLKTPVGVCRSGESIYVADSDGAAVFRLKDGDLKPFVTTGLVRPTGLASMESGGVRVVDTGAHVIISFGSDGTDLGQFGARGEGLDELNYPTFAVAHGRNGVLVNDTLNNRVKYLEDGRVTMTMGGDGDAPGAFARPKGVAVDSVGRIYVTDALLDRLQVFSPAGDILAVVGESGNGASEFWSPCGLAVEGTKILVADTYNDRLQVLRIMGDGS